jgi:hypothetical protein
MTPKDHDWSERVFRSNCLEKRMPVCGFIPDRHVADHHAKISGDNGIYEPRLFSHRCGRLNGDVPSKSQREKAILLAIQLTCHVLGLLVSRITSASSGTHNRKSHQRPSHSSPCLLSGSSSEMALLTHCFVLNLATRSATGVETACPSISTVILTLLVRYLPPLSVSSNPRPGIHRLTIFRDDHKSLSHWRRSTARDYLS